MEKGGELMKKERNKTMASIRKLISLVLPLKEFRSF